MSAAVSPVAAPSSRAPSGYVRLDVGETRLVAETDLAAALHDLLARGTLHAWAAAQPRARELRGRLPAYAVALPDEAATRVVVRHSHHGGAFARLTGDRFLAPTRAPHELSTALRLRAALVRTPTVAAYAVYRAGPLLRRADVLTREVPRSRDLAEALADSNASARVSALGATAALLASLSAAGARHPDLNIKNVLIADGGRAGDASEAWVLDVDRVAFGAPESRSIARANYDRLARSARKWRDVRALRVTDGELEELARAAGVTA